MKKLILLFMICCVFSSTIVFSQSKEEIINSIVEEGEGNSQLESLAHELMDLVGPRLVGTPQMKNSNDWVISKYEDWGIEAENQEYGKWRGWERGITHVDMLEPRVVSLSAMQLAWSPSTSKKGIIANVITFPEEVEDSISFQKWLSNVKGKIVLISMPQPTGRPDYNWEEFAKEESFEKMKEERDAQTEAWREKINATGYNYRNFNEALENAGAVGLIQSRWSNGFGANKIFSANTKKIPVVDMSLEDYGMIYRLAKSSNTPKLKIVSESKDLGTVPTFNTIAEIKGTQKPEEYVILSAHLDSWDGATGATDNGTGTITMMEAARILKKVYPNPKRTILIGHWASEEQGLNGSRAFVEDHPEIVENVQAVFNQDNGTGRVVRISGQGFLHAYDYIGRWLEAVPDTYKDEIETTFPGTPSRGGSDYASFVAADAPAFSLSSLSWSYWNYTWHTNLDTYDKIVFDDVRNNAILTAIMTYMASEDEETTSREKAVLPVNSRTGEQYSWPEPRSPQRDGGKD